jgi:putative ABC transport system substrate-binding protein
VVGFLSSLSESKSFSNPFRRGLAAMGYVEDQNVTIEYRWMKDTYETLPAMAVDLVQRRVAVICAFGPPAVLAAKAASPSIPIVFVTGADPIKFGFVASFNRPGGNMTGVWLVTAVLAEKRLEMLREVAPKAALMAILVNPKSPVAELQTRDAQTAARVLGLKLSVLTAISEGDFDNVFNQVVQQRADALMVSADPLFSSRQEQLVALAARHRVPAIYEWREFVEAGGLMSYGTIIRDGLHNSGIFVGRILKGANPADLPVEQLDKVELVVNLKTAKAMGLIVPPNLLARADEVIE